MLQRNKTHHVDCTYLISMLGTENKRSGRSFVWNHGPAYLQFNECFQSCYFTKWSMQSLKKKKLFQIPTTDCVIQTPEMHAKEYCKQAVYMQSTYKNKQQELFLKENSILANSKPCSWKRGGRRGVIFQGLSSFNPMCLFCSEKTDL